MKTLPFRKAIGKFLFRGYLFVTIGAILISALTFVFVFNVFLHFEKDNFEEVFQNWTNAVRSYGSFLMFLSNYPDFFKSEEEIEKVLRVSHDLFQHTTMFFVFGRKDGKTFSYPPYEYPPDYDPRERPWYKLALEDPTNFAVSPPLVHRFTGDLTVGFSKAIFDENGDLLGVIASDIDPGYIEREVLLKGMYILHKTGGVVFRSGKVKNLIDLNVHKPDKLNFLPREFTLVLFRELPHNFYLVHEIPLVRLILPSVLGSLLLVAFVMVLYHLLVKRVRLFIERDLERPIEELVGAFKNYATSRYFNLSEANTTIEEIQILMQKITEMVNTVETQREELEASYQELEASYQELEKLHQELEDTQRELLEKSKLLEEAYESFAIRLAEIVEGFDEATGEHVKRVRRLSRFIAEKLGLDEKMVYQIALFSPLHDLGKLFVPRDVLNKKGLLTSEEWEVVRKHPLWGARILSGESDRFAVARNIALYHHERYDGSGYPFGLKDDEIPIEAQIVGIVDVYDALRSERPYKPALPHERAVEIILKGDEKTKPSQFNPKLLEIFEKYQDEIKKIWEEG